jgi:hypothetical protein
MATGESVRGACYPRCPVKRTASGKAPHGMVAEVMPRGGREWCDSRPLARGDRLADQPNKLRAVCDDRHGLGRKSGTLPKFRAITRECPLRRCRLMIICPYPFCDASWKNGFGLLSSSRSGTHARPWRYGRRGVPMKSGSPVRCPIQVHTTLKAARCERSA